MQATRVGRRTLRVRVLWQPRCDDVVHAPLACYRHSGMLAHESSFAPHAVVTLPLAMVPAAAPQRGADRGWCDWAHAPEPRG